MWSALRLGFPVVMQRRCGTADVVRWLNVNWTITYVRLRWRVSRMGMTTMDLLVESARSNLANFWRACWLITASEYAAKKLDQSTLRCRSSCPEG